MGQTINNIIASASCDRGLVRETNEDRCFYRAFTYTSELGSEHGLIAAVADGMGGHAAGEAASELAIQVFGSKFAGMTSGGMSRMPSPDWSGLIREAFEEANSMVSKDATRWSGRIGMGTTLTAAVIVDDVMYFGHVGDSRIYMVRNGQIMQLTQDHTWVAKRVRDGLMTLEEAEVSNRRGQLTEAIGFRETIRPEIDAIALRPGDRILLCTDGITEMLADEEIYSIINRGSDLHRVTSKLVSTTNRAGGYDNIAAVLIDCPSRGERSISGQLPKLFEKTPKWTLTALAVVIMLLIADGVYLAARHTKEGRKATNVSMPEAPPPSAPALRPVTSPAHETPTADNRQYDPRMLDLRGKPVEVSPK